MKKNKKHTKVIDDLFNIPNKNGNGILKTSMTVDENKNLARYSLAYINFQICKIDKWKSDCI